MSCPQSALSSTTQHRSRDAQKIDERGVWEDKCMLIYDLLHWSPRGLEGQKCGRACRAKSVEHVAHNLQVCG